MKKLIFQHSHILVHVNYVLPRFFYCCHSAEFIRGVLAEQMSNVEAIKMHASATQSFRELVHGSLGLQAITPTACSACGHCLVAACFRLFLACFLCAGHFAKAYLMTGYHKRKHSSFKHLNALASPK